MSHSLCGFAHAFRIEIYENQVINSFQTFYFSFGSQERWKCWSSKSECSNLVKSSLFLFSACAADTCKNSTHIQYLKIRFAEFWLRAINWVGIILHAIPIQSNGSWKYDCATYWNECYFHPETWKNYFIIQSYIFAADEHETRFYFHL